MKNINTSFITRGKEKEWERESIQCVNGFILIQYYKSMIYFYFTCLMSIILIFHAGSIAGNCEAFYCYSLMFFSFGNPNTHFTFLDMSRKIHFGKWKISFIWGGWKFVKSCRKFFSCQRIYKIYLLSLNLAIY